MNIKNGNNRLELCPPAGTGAVPRRLGKIATALLADEATPYAQVLALIQTGITTDILDNNNAWTGNNTYTGTETFSNATGITTDVITARSATFITSSRGIVQKHTTAAINATATATAAEVATGYITSTSAAPVTITLPTGTLLGAALGATQGTIHELYIDNTAGANTVTIAVAVNGILSAGAVAVGASFGLLTVPSGVTGQARFTLMFSSATAYCITRTA